MHIGRPAISGFISLGLVLVFTSACSTPAPPTQSGTSASGIVSGQTSVAPTAVAVAIPPQVVPAVQSGSRAAAEPAVDVFRQNGARVVNITSLAVVPVSNAAALSTQPQGVGSGFIYDTAGHIVTNNHVVEQADQLKVTFSDRTYVAATLVGRDPDNDLAVILVNPSEKRSNGQDVSEVLRAVTLGDSSALQTGEPAIAIGSPLGLQQTVTEGIVSALRAPGEDTAAGEGLDLLGGAVQTDASINPGNSGGPLFNASGEVIGVNNAILSQSGGNEGIGFAIPINVVKRVVPELIQKGHYSHPQMGVAGVAVSSISPQSRQQLGLPPDPAQGVLVMRVTDGAQQAGIQGATRTMVINGRQVPAGGDVIVAIDGVPITTTGELRGYIENNKHPGDTISVSIVRSGKQSDVKVTLEERPVS